MEIRTITIRSESVVLVRGDDASARNYARCVQPEFRGAAVEADQRLQAIVRKTDRLRWEDGEEF